MRAVFRVVRKGQLEENELLDVEQRFGKMEDVTGIEIEPELKTIDGRQVMVGDWAEVKSLLIAEDARRGPERGCRRGRFLRS